MYLTNVLAVTPPPNLGIPSFSDGLWGWVLGSVILVLPSALLARQSHRIFGHWTRHFALWLRRSWWGMNGGSVGLAGGIFILLGARPAWDAQYAAWVASARAQDPQNAVTDQHVVRQELKYGYHQPRRIRKKTQQRNDPSEVPRIPVRSKRQYRSNQEICRPRRLLLLPRQP